MIYIAAAQPGIGPFHWNSRSVGSRSANNSSTGPLSPGVPWGLARIPMKQQCCQGSAIARYGFILGRLEAGAS